MKIKTWMKTFKLLYIINVVLAVICILLGALSIALGLSPYLLLGSGLVATFGAWIAMSGLGAAKELLELLGEEK